MDEPRRRDNPNLDYVLVDAARTVARLRDEGKVVLLHCVAAYSRTPTVAAAYAMAARGIHAAPPWTTSCRCCRRRARIQDSSTRWLASSPS